MPPATRPAEYASAIEALLGWYDDLTHGRAPTVARRRTIINDLRRAGTHPNPVVACAISHLTRPDPAHLRTNSLLAIEQLHHHTDGAVPHVDERP